MPYERTLAVMIVLSGLSVAATAGVRALAVLAVAFCGVGLVRGLLRVASAALVMDEATGSDAGRGAASSVYLAGLDLGKILGPLAGGVGAGTIGLRGTFLAAAATFPAVYFVLAALVRRRSRPLHSEHGSARTAVETH